MTNINANPSKYNNHRNEKNIVKKFHNYDSSEESSLNERMSFDKKIQSHHFYHQD